MYFVKGFRKIQINLLCALELSNPYFTSSQCLTILFKLNLSSFLWFTFASLTLISIWKEETLPFLVLNILSSECALSGEQHAGWFSQPRWWGEDLGSCLYLEEGCDEESWRWGRDGGRSTGPQVHDNTMCLRAPHSPEGEAYSTSLSSSNSPGRKQVALTVLSPVKNPIWSRFKLSSPNSVRRFGVHGMVASYSTTSRQGGLTNIVHTDIAQPTGICFVTWFFSHESWWNFPFLFP